ncbi:HAAS signaling domain-containing protein [Streptomyces sp. ODS05-4]|uniref:HAAS signaling domain-containing protein n=1 Tax=Streptomyces sp. ODS05-4 TaxID=2944939 RepID=UPI00210B7353|nr:hypothetical protein [Streptomyces sp. ODS05-4]
MTAAAIVRTHPFVRRYLAELMRHAGPASPRERAELADALADHVGTVVREASGSPDRAVLEALADLGDPRLVAEARGWAGLDRDRRRDWGVRAAVGTALLGIAAGGPLWHAHPAAVTLADLVLAAAAAAVLARPGRPGPPTAAGRS